MDAGCWLKNKNFEFKAEQFAGWPDRLRLGAAGTGCQAFNIPMAAIQQFKAVFPYQQDVLALPVKDIDAASEWYSKHFGMEEVERSKDPVPTVILERDGTRIGFSINGGDASQDGAAILVSNIQCVKEELESMGVAIANWRIDERDGQKLQVFFVVAPDELCYYFYEPIQQ